MLEPGGVSYGDLTFQHSHPGIIAAIASLVGLTPPAVETCRVLELGCGTGFNLLAMTQSIPAGHFTGIDYSPAHIGRANEVAAAIGAENVEFHCLSINDFPTATNSFDYIIAHGVYSWVPAATRDAIFTIIQQCLSPQGVGYVSYNTHPGWHLRSLVRDSLRYFANPRQALDTITQSFINPDSIYARALHTEWAAARDQPDYYIAHEYLVPNCDPLYFHEFVRHANSHQLQFAAEARFFTNSFAQTESIQTQLRNAADDPIQREQYLDWLVGRYFRQTLLCHAGLPLRHEPDPGSVLDLNIALTTEKPSEVTDEMYLEVLEQLKQTGAVPAHQIELAGMPPAFVAAVLWSGCRDGHWAIRADAPPTTPIASARPVACPLARYQAAAGPDCTNRHHRTVRLTPEERQLLQTLDGSVAPPNHPSLARFAALALLTTPSPAIESAR